MAAPGHAAPTETGPALAAGPRARWRVLPGPGRPPAWARPKEARRPGAPRRAAVRRWSRSSTCSPPGADREGAHGSRRRLLLPAWRRRRRSRWRRSAQVWVRVAPNPAARPPGRPGHAGVRPLLSVSRLRSRSRQLPGPSRRVERRDAAPHDRPSAGRGRLARLRSRTSGSSHRSRDRCTCQGLPCWSAPTHGQARRRGFSWATGGSVLSDRGAAQRSGSRALARPYILTQRRCLVHPCSHLRGQPLLPESPAEAG